MKRRTYLRNAAATAVGVSVLHAGIGGAAADEATDEYVQGEAAVELSVREREDDENISYIEEDDEVEFPAAMSGDEVAIYETSSWDTFASRRCISAASETGREYVDGQFDVFIGGGGVTSTVEGEELAASVHATEGELSLDELVAETPASVAATYELEDNSYEMDVPIYATINAELVALGETPPDEESEDAGDSDTDGTVGEENGGVIDAFGPGFGVLGSLASITGVYFLRRNGTESPRD